jgi:hypothetical protein
MTRHSIYPDMIRGRYGLSAVPMALPKPRMLSSKSSSSFARQKRLPAETPGLTNEAIYDGLTDEATILYGFSAFVWFNVYHAQVIPTGTLIRCRRRPEAV